MPSTSKSSTSKTKKTKKKSSKDKKRSKKTKSTKKTTTAVEEVIEEVAQVAPVAPVAVVQPPEAVTTTTTPKKRRVVDRDSVLVDFDSLQQAVEAEIESCRSASDKSARVSGVKFLRSLNKQLKQLKKDTTRAMKQKRKNPNRAKNTSSGFMKPVQISKEMATFTGWDSAELKSRVDVTKYICGYIREHDLQNPADRRQIVPDSKLTRLLKLDKKSLKDDPLTYYTLQKKIQPHFVTK